MAGCCGEVPAPSGEVQESEFCSALWGLVVELAWLEGEEKLGFVFTPLTQRAKTGETKDAHLTCVYLGMCQACQIQSGESISAPQS